MSRPLALSVLPVAWGPLARHHGQVPRSRTSTVASHVREQTRDGWRRRADDCPGESVTVRDCPLATASIKKCDVDHILGTWVARRFGGASRQLGRSNRPATWPSCDEFPPVQRRRLGGVALGQLTAQPGHIPRECLDRLRY
jgi:hypothetical protein